MTDHSPGRENMAMLHMTVHSAAMIIKELTRRANSKTCTCEQPSAHFSASTNFFKNFTALNFKIHLFQISQINSKVTSTSLIPIWENIITQ